MGKVKTLHPQYLEMRSKWSRCRDVAAGQDAVYAKGETYLPSLKDQSPEQYKAMQQRTPFYNATWRTIDGYKGLLFRKPERLDVPAAIEPYLKDVNRGGESLHIFVEKLALELLTVGRAGVMIDYPSMPADTILTVARAEALGLRPHMQRYSAESIINWKTANINNETRLILIVLEEDMPVQSEFEHKTEKRYRVLDLVMNLEGQHIYRQRLFMVDERENDVQVGPTVVPLMNGKPLDFIPFYLFGMMSLDPCCEEPPLIDLVDLNLKHFKVSATYEHGCHFTGLPTPVVSGFTPQKDTKLQIGSTVAWVFDNPQAKASYLEFSGAGLSSLERNLERKEAQMAAIGARLLMNDPKAAETATTATIRHSGETSILGAAAQALSDGMGRVLQVFSRWSGQDSETIYEIDRNFFPVPMDATMLSALVNAWHQGALSQEELFRNLKRGEVVADDATFEEEQAKIEATRPEIAPTMPLGNATTLLAKKDEQGEDA